jgi:tRNA-Thr(GGU) m(6)t(6)A37 methyltransferase TsaA
MFERYTEDARRTLFFARYEASQLGGLTIEPEHLLLGLIREARVKDLLPEGLEHARRAIEKQLQPRTRLSTSVEIPFSPPTQRILSAAAREADVLHQPYIGSEHLLIGILREDDAIAARYLHSAGVRLDAARGLAAKGRSGDPLAVAADATMRITLKSIGEVRSPYHDVTAIPKGLGAQHGAEGVLELRSELEPGLADIEGFSHLYVVWCFHRVDRVELTAHPPSDDRPHGVFATRSPRRPNPIGLTVVELLRRDGSNLHVRGLDMLDGTPILDIKPYLTSIPVGELRRGWLADAERRHGEQARTSHGDEQLT